MKTSRDWVGHFTQNLKKQRIDWELKPQITTQQKKAILYSLKAWQKGETSDGRHLLAAAARYDESRGDEGYLEAIKLFIQEEQKHGENLGRYLDALGERRMKFDLGDYLFRSVRYFNTSMEVWTITVLIVESAAQVFYRSLKNATTCPLLRQICSDILIDEAYHIRFQQERLADILGNASFSRMHFTLIAYRGFLESVMLAIWAGHARAFKAGGVNRQAFKASMRRKLDRVFASLQQEWWGQRALRKAGAVAGL